MRGLAHLIVDRIGFDRKLIVGFMGVQDFVFGLDDLIADLVA